MLVWPLAPGAALVTRDPDPDDHAAGAWLDRLTTMPQLLTRLCECYGYAPADEDPRDHPEHYWGCPAGELTYWCTRHPQAVADWLWPYLAGSSPPPPPR
jgi:hypothetical protein